MSELYQALSQVPDDSFRSAIGEHWNGGTVNKENAHWLQSMRLWACPSGRAALIEKDQGDAQREHHHVVVVREVDVAQARDRVHDEQARHLLAGDRGEAPQATGRDRKSTRLNSSHIQKSRMPSSA